MRGVNLQEFVFDYDLTWAGFFLNAQGHVYGRFGGRDAESPDKYLTLAGLKYAMRAALAAHREEKDRAAEPTKKDVVEHYAEAKRLKPNACIHCHQVYDFRREERKAAGTWKLEDIWVYPLPESVGLSIVPEQGDKVRSIQADSAAARTGLQPGDLLRRVHGQRIASFADLQYALNLAPATGSVEVVWERNGKKQTGMLALMEGWRKSDISWRGSMWGIDPQASVYGKDLTVEEKRALGLSEKALAFRQGNYVPPAAREAGIRGGDIILGISGMVQEMTMLQFNVHVRLTYKNGDTVRYALLRDGQRKEVTVKLSGRR